MRWNRPILLGLCLVSLGLSTAAGLAAAPPPGPDRYAAEIIEYTAYEWWLVEWGGFLTCVITVDHAGQPTPDEIYLTCGKPIYDAWLKQKPCPPDVLENTPEACSGYYIQFSRSYLAEREIAVPLPEPQVWVSLEGCSALPALGTQVCPGTPVLTLTGEEPLAGETILRLEGEFNGAPFLCDPVCEIELGQTGESGLELKFWAYSSYGDSSRAFKALVRVIPTEDGDPEQSYYFVDVLSTQWTGEAVAACGESWDAFPPPGGVPGWLSTPEDPELLSSDVPYALLAGNLIAQGYASAEECEDGGLLENGAASPCGLSAARSEVTAWQNQFDERILEIAQETGVPAQALKNLFARESQFWPGGMAEGEEAGLGHLTEGGADIAFLWNPGFFDQFCPSVFSQETCDLGYTHLEEEDQELLRSALVSRVNADCPACPLGLDLERSLYSIEVFAHTLRASCDQTGRIIRNLTEKSPGALSGYEDLWRFTLTNYNAGPGCLGEALEQTLADDQDLNWQEVSIRLDPACEGAIQYVEEISR